MISRFRPILFWLHLAVGLVAGLFILNMAGSGILIAYEKQITALAERDQRTVAVPEGTVPLDLEALVAQVEAARPDAALASVTLSSDPAAAAQFNLGREAGILYADPYTGDIIGEGNPAVRGFFRSVTSWHRWLALEGTLRPVGKEITGAVAVAYFILLCSGLCLWLPQRWSLRRVKQGALFDPGLRGKARDWNWHNTIGLWCAPLLLCVTLTGILMSYDWAGNLLFRLTGSPLTEHRHEGGRGGEGQSAEVDVSGINPLLTRAEQQVPAWRTITLRLPSSPEAPATFLIDDGNGTRPDTASQLTLDRDTGEVKRWQPYASQNAGQRLHSWVRPIHTGEAGGWIGQSIAVLAALGGILLVWTGFSLAWRRFFGGKPLSQP